VLSVFYDRSCLEITVMSNVSDLDVEHDVPRAIRAHVKMMAVLARTFEAHMGTMRAHVKMMAALVHAFKALMRTRRAHVKMMAALIRLLEAPVGTIRWA
jgi:hypothetical protein